MLGLKLNHVSKRGHWSHAALALLMQGKQVIGIHEGLFKLFSPFQCWEIRENVNSFYIINIYVFKIQYTMFETR